jgi:DNA-binding NtrC family response regulator
MVSPRTETQSATDLADAHGVQERPRPHLFVVFDRGRPLAGGARHALVNIERVALGRAATREAKRAVDGGVHTLTLGFADARMSTMHARIERRGEAWRLVDCNSTNGVRINGQRVEAASLTDGDVIELGQTFLRFRAQVLTPANAPGDVDASKLGGMLARFGTLCPRLSRTLDRLERIARSDASTLLEGETGTGKEVLARAIHDESGRRGPFVPVNCAALPGTIVESLLFGHRKGAFSGASSDEPGLVRAAHGGTLFLDEIGDLSLATQAVLLRVLQEREVLSLGATRAEKVDVRFVAATHRPVKELVATGAFRADLHARIAQFSCALPPLRDRMEDLGVLVAALLPRVAGDRAAGLSFGAEAARRLIDHPWPANVRELEHALKVGVLLAEDDRVDHVDPARGCEPQAMPEAAKVAIRALSAADAALERELVAKMTEHGGNVTQVAEAMGKARRQVQRWLGRFGIEAARFRP